MRRNCIWLFFLAALGIADDNRSLGDRTRQYLTDLVRLDTSAGNETRVAEYLKQVADSHGIVCELVGAEPRRMNFVGRLRGNGKGRPLLLMAHSDVVPADRTHWTVDPFAAETRNGYIYGRGTWDAKSLLAAEMAVMVEIKRRNIRLNRDLILVSEGDEETGSSGIQWLVQRAWPKIDAEFGLNEGGAVFLTHDGTRIFQVETSEKLPTRIVLTAKGTAGQAAVPRADNPIVHLMRAALKLTDADQPVRLTGTTRRYLQDLAKLDDYTWLTPLLPRLDNPATAQAAAAQVRMRDATLDAMFHTTVSPTISRAGVKINVIPNLAEAQVDVRRLPNETTDEVLARFRQIVNDPAVEIALAPGALQADPPPAPSPRNGPMFRSLEKTIARIYAKDSVVVPFMSGGATDGTFLRSRGMAVYGVPLFLREGGESPAHGNDERISTKTLEDGVELLWQIVLDAAGETPAL
jgi:acetylornithine deacetylase/succinyl-diaminopimelate desuccinylase-like protein